MIIFNKSQNLSRGLIFVKQAFPENSQVQNTGIVATQTLDDDQLIQLSEWILEKLMIK